MEQRREDAVTQYYTDCSQTHTVTQQQSITLYQSDQNEGVYPSEKFTPLVQTQNKMVSSSKGVELMVGGLDHSGSQPFNSTHTDSYNRTPQQLVDSTYTPHKSMQPHTK